MNSIRIQLLKTYPEAIETFGFITKANRQNLNLEKDHYIDACVIASSGNNFIENNEIFYKKVVGKNNRSLSTFRKVPVQITKGKINGFRRYDKVEYQGKEYFIFGRMSSGYTILQDIFGNKPNTGYKTLGYVKTKELKRTQSRKGKYMKILRIGYINLSNSINNIKNIPFNLKTAPQVLFIENYKDTKPRVNSITTIYQCKYRVLSISENQIICIKDKLKESEGIIVKPASVVRTIEVLNDPIKGNWINICGIEFPGKLNKSSKQDYEVVKKSILSFKNKYDENKLKDVIFGNINVDLICQNDLDNDLMNFMQDYQSKFGRRISYDTDMATNDRVTAIDENKKLHFVDYAYVYTDCYGQIKVKNSNKFITDHKYLELQVQIWEEKDHKDIEMEDLFLKQPLKFRQLYSELRNNYDKNVKYINLKSTPSILINLNINNTKKPYIIYNENNNYDIWILKDKNNKINKYTFNKNELLNFLNKLK